MEPIRNLVGVEEIGDNGIKFPFEKMRQNFMLVLFALVLYSFPAFPSKSTVYCVHKCLWEKPRILNHSTRNETETAKGSPPYRNEVEDEEKVCQSKTTAGHLQETELKK